MKQRVHVLHLLSCFPTSDSTSSSVARETPAQTSAFQVQRQSQQRGTTASGDRLWLEEMKGIIKVFPQGCTKDMSCPAALGRDRGIHALNANASVMFWMVLYSLTSPGDRGRSKSETERQPIGKGLMLLIQLELGTRSTVQLLLYSMSSSTQFAALQRRKKCTLELVALELHVSIWGTFSISPSLNENYLSIAKQYQ